MHKKEITESEEKITRGNLVRTVETGTFIRTKLRKGNKTKTETRILQPNKQKYVLCKVGDFELYVYPFDYPDKVFLGKYPKSTEITKTNVNMLLGAYNQACWFLANRAFSKPTRNEGANSRRQAIVNAYNERLKQQTKPEMRNSSLNYNLDNSKRKKKSHNRALRFDIE